MEKQSGSSVTSHYPRAKPSLHRPLSCNGVKTPLLPEALGSRGVRRWRVLAASCLCVPQGDHLCRHRPCQPQTAHPPTPPGCQGTHQAEGDCGVAWRGGTCHVPLVLTPLCSLSSLCPPAGTCCSQLMPTLSLGGWAPASLPSDLCLQVRRL